MTVDHLELLVEEPSMEAFLNELLSRVLPADCTFKVHPFQGKPDLLQKLPERLRAYARWLPGNYRILVIVDRDDDDCVRLKTDLDVLGTKAGLVVRSGNVRWQLVNRLAIEELESWYFGDWKAVVNVYPRVSATIPAKAGFRDPDAIQGGTWEAFERVCKRAGYFTTGLRKTEAARMIGQGLDPNRCTSQSFRKFHQTLIDAVG